MAEIPQTWHYGVMALWWAEFNGDAPEVDFLRQFVEGDGQPALDAACGAGRVLLPCLRAGWDVDGCDISADMLERCREKAEREGFSPRLYAQPIHELDLPRKYKTIFICDSFGLGGSRRHDQEALVRFYEHLGPGGVLVLNMYPPYEAAEPWQYWLKEKRKELPEPWPSSGSRKRISDGSEIELRVRRVAMDPLEQCMTLEMRAELWRDGQLVAADEHPLKEMWYFKNELVMMLEHAGFHDIDLRGDYSGAQLTADSDMYVFIARK